MSLDTLSHASEVRPFAMTEELESPVMVVVVTLVVQGIRVGLVAHSIGLQSNK